MAIKTREELLMALTEACELEHGLACQYLFAVFTLKSPPDPSITPDQWKVIRGWRSDLMRIAKEEMEHLGTVTNLLSAIGGGAHFRRPNFPRPSQFYPPKIPFWLARFEVESLKRFVEFERNEKAPPALTEAAPEEVDYMHVGELYEQIVAAFKTIPETELFINTAAQDVTLTDFTYVLPEQAKSRAEAVAALESLMAEGEAYKEGVEYSHYLVFKKMHDTLVQMQKDSPGFDPARKVAKNPLTRRHRGLDEKDANRITNLKTRAVVEWFNQTYFSMLLTFQQFYAFAGETGEQRSTLNSAIMMFMVSVVGPLGVLTTKLPLNNDQPVKENAGPSFELYGEFRLSSTPKIAWTVIIEKLSREIDDGNALVADNPGIADIVASLTAIRDSLQAVRPT